MEIFYWFCFPGKLWCPQVPWLACEVMLLATEARQWMALIPAEGFGVLFKGSSEPPLFREWSEMVIFYFLDNHSGCRSVEDGSPRKLDSGDHDPQGNNSLEHSAKPHTSGSHVFHLPAIQNFFFGRAQLIPSYCKIIWGWSWAKSLLLIGPQCSGTMGEGRWIGGVKLLFLT